MHLLHLLLGLKDLKNRSFLRQLFYEIVLIMQNIIHCQLILLKIQFLTFFDISSYNKYYDFSIDRYSSILHTRLFLNCSALKYYL